LLERSRLSSRLTYEYCWVIVNAVYPLYDDSIGKYRFKTVYRID